jgi:hypothetical protein
MHPTRGGIQRHFSLSLSLLHSLPIASVLNPTYLNLVFGSLSNAQMRRKLNEKIFGASLGDSRKRGEEWAAAGEVLGFVGFCGFFYFFGYWSC